MFNLPKSLHSQFCPSTRFQLSYAHGQPPLRTWKLPFLFCQGLLWVSRLFFLRILKISINAHVHVGDQYRTYHMSRFVSRRLDWSATIQSRCKQSFDCHTYCNNSFTTRLWNHKQPCVADMLLSLIVFSSYATYDTRIDSRSFIRSSFRHGVWALTDRHVRDETIISHAVAR